MMDMTTFATSSHGVVQRIRTPHPHDVLSGRGGGINGHVGNVQFREWVRVRKEDYNLAPSKVEKARVAKEVIAQVRNQNPPGRFLQKDPSAGVGNWWVEVDEDRVLAKTSQALREGAPQIRAAHDQELKDARKQRINANNKKSITNKPKTAATIPNKAVFRSGILRKRSLANTLGAAGWPAPPQQTTRVTPSGKDNDIAYHEKSILELRSTLEQARMRNDMLENDPVIRAEKRRRMGENAATASFGTPPAAPSRNSFAQEKRHNSLALPEFSMEELTDDFVNPFADESEEFLKQDNHQPRHGVYRETSNGSHGNLAGLASLTSFSELPPLPKPQTFVPRLQSGQSVNTNISQLDWENDANSDDPLMTYLANLTNRERSIATQ